MQLKLKPLSEQTIVITGATSGIGLCTARLAAERGANVVAVARNEDALSELVDEISSIHGGTMLARRSTAASWTLRLKICAVCLKPTSGAWSTVRASPSTTCANVAAR